MAETRTGIHFFEIILDRVETVFETPGYVSNHIKIRKINKTRVAVGYIENFVEFGNNIKTEYKVLKKQG